MNKVEDIINYKYIYAEKFFEQMQKPIIPRDL